MICEFLLIINNIININFDLLLLLFIIIDMK